VLSAPLSTDAGGSTQASIAIGSAPTSGHSDFKTKSFKTNSFKTNSFKTNRGTAGSSKLWNEDEIEWLVELQNGMSPEKIPVPIEAKDSTPAFP
jgi:hypothetical protein